MTAGRIAAADESSQEARSALCSDEDVTALHGRLTHARDEIAALRRRVEELEGERADIRSQLERILLALGALQSG